MKIELSGFETADDVEDAFYAAFASCDIKAMQDVWADDEIVCIHPGSKAIFGYDNVIRSWRHIFHEAELPDIIFNIVNSIESEVLAIHVVEEHIVTGNDSAVVILATNVYQNFDNGWLMIEHHGSVIQTQVEGITLQ